MSSFQDTDATFHTRMPVTTFHEPSLVFMLYSRLGTVAPFRNDHMSNAQVMGKLFIGVRG